jgi:uncharacterized protein YkwD
MRPIQWVVFTFIAISLAACGSPNDSSGTSVGLGEASLSAFKLSCEEARFLKLINIYRQQSGRSALLVSPSATAAARWHARDMGEKAYFSHTDSLGRDPSSRLNDFGYGGLAGENVAAGNAVADATFCQWKNSAGHNVNMLRAEFRVIGIGATQISGSPYGTYWSTPFGFSVTDDDGTTAVSNPSIQADGCLSPSALPGC